jgi:hypothetical protein
MEIKPDKNSFLIEQNGLGGFGPHQSGDFTSKILFLEDKIAYCE